MGTIDILKRMNEVKTACYETQFKGPIGCSVASLPRIHQKIRGATEQHGEQKYAGLSNGVVREDPGCHRGCRDADSKNKRGHL